MTPQDEFARRREVEEGRKATALLENPYFKSVTERVKDKIWQEFSTTRIDDDTTRKNARLLLGAMNEFLTIIRRDEETGKLASEQLRREAERVEREKQRKEFI